MTEQVGEDWTANEVQLIVADYLSMLTLELNSQRYNKTAHRERLRSYLPNRSAGAIEFKHANISAVMLELGYPYINGYKPRANFQRKLLTEVVYDQVMRHALLDEATLSAVQRPAEVVQRMDFAQVKTNAPRREQKTREPEAAYARPPVKRDYLQREAANRTLGRAGESFAVDFERWRLIHAGSGQLADRVEHVAVTQGDGLGYDICSFEPNGEPRLIEVKTTTFGECTPFFVSANELRFASANPQHFRLYRLFDFRVAPRLFELAGRIDQHCQLDPTTFRASFG